jgi:hypothetical protein
MIGATVGTLLLLSSPSTVVHAQPSARKLLDDASIGGASRRHLPALRVRKAKGHPNVLTDSDVIVNLFDDLQLTVHRTGVEKYLKDHFVWHGRTDDGDIVTIALVRGVMMVTVHGNGRSFEVAPEGNGTYVVTELDSASFPTEDPAGDNAEPIVTPGGDDRAAGDAASGSSSPAAGADVSGGTTIDAMVMWTPAARNAVGGSVDAIQSLVLSAVANANQAFVNSGVNAHYRLVYSGEVNFTESKSAISSDLNALAANNSVQSLRAQHGADVVTMIGSGYAGAGFCGYGYIMATVSTTFAPYAFSVVDQSCAAGNLSYAHEAGHNEGLQHDPANAGSAPSYPYAYGYQDPAGKFRTVMSYGGETRIPYYSSPLVTFNGTPTGVASQDNARALNNNLGTVANFVAATDGSVPAPVPQPCTYAVSAGGVTFSAAASSVNLSVTTASECGWTTTSSAAWISVTAGTSGSGTVNVSVTANAGGTRTGLVTIAGQPVTITQSAQPPCSFTVSPGAFSVASGATSSNVSVTTTTGCTWSTSSGASWITIANGKSGSGTVKVSVASNSGAARSGSVTVAGKVLVVSQAAPSPKPLPRGKK